MRKRSGTVVAAESRPDLPAEMEGLTAAEPYLAAGVLPALQASRSGELSRGMSGKAGKIRSQPKLKRMMNGESGRADPMENRVVHSNSLLSSFSLLNLEAWHSRFPSFPTQLQSLFWYDQSEMVYKGASRATLAHVRKRNLQPCWL